MTPTVFILILNPIVSTILAGALFVLWLHQRHLRYVQILALGFLSKTIAYVLQFVALGGFADLARFGSNLLFLVTVILLSVGLIRRHGGRPPIRLQATVSLVAIGVLSWYLVIEPNYVARVLVINGGLAVISFIGAWWLRPLARANFIERLQVYTLATQGVFSILRPLPIFLPGAAPTLSIESTYWLGVTGSDIVVSLVLVLSIFAGVALDIFGKLRSDSVRDALSGLLNRRGFEDEAAQLLVRTAASGLPATLILADLDHFKRINDTYGHSLGDRVIVAFSQHLTEVAGAEALVARIGGEEFVALVPSADAAIGKLLAESMRHAFGAAAVAGLPASSRATASFGVAVLAPGENLEGALSAADRALYRAKAEGRDRVRVAEPPARMRAVRADALVRYTAR